MYIWVKTRALKVVRNIIRIFVTLPRQVSSKFQWFSIQTATSDDYSTSYCVIQAVTLNFEFTSVQLAKKRFKAKTQLSTFTQDRTHHNSCATLEDVTVPETIAALAINNYCLGFFALKPFHRLEFVWNDNETKTKRMNE